MITHFAVLQNQLPQGQAVENTNPIKVINYTLANCTYKQQDIKQYIASSQDMAD